MKKYYLFAEDSRFLKTSNLELELLREDLPFDPAKVDRETWSRFWMNSDQLFYYLRGVQFPGICYLYVHDDDDDACLNDSYISICVFEEAGKIKTFDLC